MIGILTNLMPSDKLVVCESAFPFGVVVVVVEVEGLTKEVLGHWLGCGSLERNECTNQALKMLKTLNVGGKSAAVSLVYFDLIGREIGLGCFFGRYSYSSI